MIKIIHTADWHANKDFEKFKKSYLELLKYVKDNNTDLVVIAGDIFDSRVYADKNYNRILNMVAKLSEYCPVLIIYGTPSHDYKGSLDQLKDKGRTYPITVVENITDTAYMLNTGPADLTGPDYKLLEIFSEEELKRNKSKEWESVILSCLPWPMKYRLLSDEEMKLPFREQDSIYSKRIQEWLAGVKDFKKYGVPTFLVSHLQLQGSIHLKDQDISSDNHNPADYFDVADYAMLGHIHKHQNIRNLHYSGSLYNKTWNEMEDKYFNVWTIDDGNVSFQSIRIDTPKKIKIECTLKEYKQFKNLEVDTVSKLLKPGNSYELWFVISLPKKEQLDIEKEEKWWTWYEDGIDIGCRIDLNTLKIEISERAKNFDIKTSLTEKYKTWCKDKSLDYTEFQLNKLKELEVK